jgi:hypothetical protein
MPRCVCGGSYVVCSCRECQEWAVTDREICCGVCRNYPALFADFHRAVLEGLGIV